MALSTFQARLKKRMAAKRSSEVVLLVMMETGQLEASRIVEPSSIKKKNPGLELVE